MRLVQLEPDLNKFFSLTKFGGAEPHRNGLSFPISKRL